MVSGPETDVGDSAESRWPRRLAIGALLASALFVLSWFHVLPGGWRLRGLFGDPTAPARAEEARRVRARLRAFEAENPGITEPAVVFLGSSTIEHFPVGELFPGVRVLNRGIGAETSEELLRRIDLRLPAAPAAAWVLYSGTVDLRRDGRPVSRIVTVLRGVIDRLRAASPEAPILILGLVSTRDATPESQRQSAELDAALARLAATTGASFLPLSLPPLVDDAGRLPEALSVDRYHLNREGYEHLARRIRLHGGAVGRLLSR